MVFGCDDVFEVDLNWGALVTTAYWTLLELREPCLNVIVVATVTAHLAPEVHTFNGELTHTTPR